MPSTLYFPDTAATMSDLPWFRPQTYVKDSNYTSPQQSYDASIRDGAETESAARSALVRLTTYGLNFIASLRSADESRGIARGLARLLASSGAIGMQALRDARGGSDETAFLDVVEALGGTDDVRPDAIDSVRLYLAELQTETGSVAEIASDALEQIAFNAEPTAAGV